MTAVRELDAAQTGSDLVPGSPAELWAASDGYAETARSVAAVMAALGSLDPRSWIGEAATAFADSRDGIVDRLRDAAQCFAVAAEALGRHAAVLGAAQASADDARAQYRRGAACLPPTGLGNPTLTSTQTAALATLVDAREAAARSATTAADSLDEATARAPRAGGFWNETGATWAHFWRGAWEPVEGLGMLAWRGNLVRAAAEPEAWSRDTTALADALGSEVVHPRQLGKDLVDWDTWASDPARAAGALLPEAALALVSGGTGSVAARGATRAARVAERVAAREGEGAAAGAADAAADSVGRSATRASADRPATHAVEIELKWPFPLKPVDATARWEEFLGPEPYSSLNPRTGLPDLDRLVSADGWRSIRFGRHEMNSKPENFHFHEESWSFDEQTGVWTVHNLQVRVPLPKGTW